MTTGPLILPPTGTATTMTTGRIVVVKPAACTPNVHVWACDHAAWCTCRTAWREVPARAWCPVCGQ